MKLAPIAPTSLAHVAFQTGYIMTLPLSMQNASFAYSLQSAREEHRGSFVLLDNGLSEAKKPMQTIALLQLASSFQPDEVIMPDYLRDTQRTLTETRLSAEVFRSYGYTGGLMGVAQGQSFEDYLDCVYELLGTPVITTIGISKYFQTVTGLPRSELLQTIEEHGLHKRGVEWHLLGLCETLMELSAIARAHPWLRGIDTCFPVLAGMQGIDLATEVNSELELERNGGAFSLPPDYFNFEIDRYAPPEIVMDLVSSNIRITADAAKGRL